MTPIELLVKRLAENGILHSSDIAEANELFKQQIEEAHKKGQHYSDRFEVPHQIVAEQYYINNFKPE